MSSPRLVADIRLGSFGFSPRHLTAAGSTIFFSTNDGSSGQELWKSDGTVRLSTLLTRWREALQVWARDGRLLAAATDALRLGQLPQALVELKARLASGDHLQPCCR